MEYLLVVFDDIGEGGVRILGIEVTTSSKEEYIYSLIKSYYDHYLFGVLKLPLNLVTKKLLDETRTYDEPRSYYYNDEESLDYDSFDEYLERFQFRYISEDEAKFLSSIFKKWGFDSIVFSRGNIMR